MVFAKFIQATRTFLCAQVTCRVILSSAFWLGAERGFAADAAVASAPEEFRSDQILVQPLRGLEPNVLARFHAKQGSELLGIFDSSDGLQVVSVAPGETVSALV